MAKLNFDPAKEIPSLTGKVILVTGGTSGLGRETVLSFAAHSPAHIYFTGRSQPSADSVIQEAGRAHPGTPVTFIPCDLASLASVKRAAQDFLARETRLDVLMANAGIMAVPAGLTQDGYEIQFGTNHVGHALLAKLLTPVLGATAAAGTGGGGDARIVWTTSLGHRGHPRGGIAFETLRTPQTDLFPLAPSWVRYGQSKLANLLYARAFARHHPAITSVSVHPGIANTNLVSSLGWADRALVFVTSYWNMIPPAACAWNQQWAATAARGPGEREVESGTYYEPVGKKGALMRAAPDEELAEKLWEWTQTELEGWEL